MRQPDEATEIALNQQLHRAFYVLRERASDASGEARDSVHAAHGGLIDAVARAIDAALNPPAPPKSAA